MDFLQDVLSNGRRFRVFAAVDDFSRECLALVVDTSISGARVDRELDRIVDPPIVLFHYAPGRGKEHPLKFLAGYRGRFLQCDAYQSYTALTEIARENGPWQLVHCWTRRQWWLGPVAQPLATAAAS